MLPVSGTSPSHTYLSGSIIGHTLLMGPEILLLRSQVKHPQVCSCHRQGLSPHRGSTIKLSTVADGTPILTKVGRACGTRWAKGNGYVSCIRSYRGAGEMASGLRELTTLPEDPRSTFPTPTLGSHQPPVTPAPAGLTPSSGLLEHCTHVPHTHTDIHMN